MEERFGGLHQIKLTNRKNGTISGVVDVLSFDENEILLDTTEGRLIVRGKNLHVGRLQLEEGEVDMDGEVESMVGKRDECIYEQRTSAVFEINLVRGVACAYL